MISLSTEDRLQMLLDVAKKIPEDKLMMEVWSYFHEGELCKGCLLTHFTMSESGKNLGLTLGKNNMPSFIGCCYPFSAAACALSITMTEAALLFNGYSNHTKQAVITKIENLLNTYKNIEHYYA